MNWNAYVLRRKIDAGRWLASRGIKDRESFIRAVASLGLEPPDGSQLELMFPDVKTTKVEEVNNESVTVTPEGIDQVATRSVAPEGDGSDLRPDGKRTTKVRSQ